MATVNAGLPVFTRPLYGRRIGQRALEDLLEGDDAALPLVELLSGLSRDELFDLAEYVTLDLAALNDYEPDPHEAARLEELGERLVQDVLALFLRLRLTLTLPEDDGEFEHDLDFQADAGELALFSIARCTTANPQKGGGFTCFT